MGEYDELLNRYAPENRRPEPEPESDLDYYLVQGDGDSFDEAPPKESSQFVKGIRAGIDQTEAMGGGVVAAFGDALGFDSLKEWGLSTYENNMAEARENQGRVAGFTDIESFDNAVDWALYTAGNMAPMLATSLASGGLGAFAAKKLATSAAGKILAAETAKGSTLKAAQLAAANHLAKAATIGGGVGAYLSSAGMETGSIYGELQDIEGIGSKAGTAFAHGAIAGALDALPQMKVLSRLGVGRVAGDEITESVKKFVGKQILTEGLTEGLQTIVEQHAKYWIDENQGMFEPHHWKEIIDASAAGALMGGTIGGVTGALGRKDPGEAVAEGREEAAASGGDSLAQTIAGNEGLLNANIQNAMVSPLDEVNIPYELPGGITRQPEPVAPTIPETFRQDLDPSLRPSQVPTTGLLQPEGLVYGETPDPGTYDELTITPDAPYETRLERREGILRGRQPETPLLPAPEPIAGLLPGRTRRLTADTGMEGIPAKIGRMDSDPAEIREISRRRLEEVIGGERFIAERVSDFEREKVGKERAKRLPPELQDQRLLNENYRKSLESTVIKLDEETKNVNNPVVNPAVDDLFTAIAKMGGISKEELSADGFDPKDMTVKAGIRTVFKKDGRSVDDMAESLSQDGVNYLKNHDIEELKELIREQLAGNDHYSSLADPALSFGEQSSGGDIIALSAKAIGVTAGRAKAAINKALKGESLTPKQAELVSSIMDEIGGQRSNYAEGLLDVRSQRNQLRKAVRDNELIEADFNEAQLRISDPEYTEVDDSEYEADLNLSAEERMVAEALSDASIAGIPDVVTEKLMEDHESPQKLVAAIYRQIRAKETKAQQGEIKDEQITESEKPQKVVEGQAASDVVGGEEVEGRVDQEPSEEMERPGRPEVEEEAPVLETYTEEELKQEAKVLKDKEEAEAKIQKEAEEKAKADAAVDDFDLTGSDRVADTARQGDVFDEQGQTKDRPTQARKQTLDEFKEDAYFVKQKGKRTRMVQHHNTIYQLKSDEQKNGKLLKSGDEIFERIYQGIIKSHRDSVDSAVFRRDAGMKLHAPEKMLLEDEGLSLVKDGTKPAGQVDGSTAQTLRDNAESFERMFGDVSLKSLARDIAEISISTNSKPTREDIKMLAEKHKVFPGVVDSVIASGLDIENIKARSEESDTQDLAPSESSEAETEVSDTYTDDELEHTPSDENVADPDGQVEDKGKKPALIETKEKKNDLGPHHASGRKAKEGGKDRVLPNYFTSPEGHNAKAWLKGWDEASLGTIEGQTTESWQNRRDEVSDEDLNVALDNIEASIERGEQDKRVTENDRYVIEKAIHAQAKINRINKVKGSFTPNQVLKHFSHAIDSSDYEGRIAGLNSAKDILFPDGQVEDITPLDGWRGDLIKTRDYANKLRKAGKLNSNAALKVWSDAEKLAKLIDHQESKRAESDQPTTESDQPTPESDQPTLVGKNRKGHSVYVDANGVRSYTGDKGVRVTQKVSLVPSRDGVQSFPTNDTPESLYFQRERDFLTVEEYRSVAKGKSEDLEKEKSITDELTEMSDDDLSALIDDVASETNAVDNTKPVKERETKTKSPTTGKTEPKPKRTKAEQASSGKDEDVKRTAAKIAGSLGINVSSAGKNAIEGLTSLFGGKGTLSSGLTFDEESYAKAKPHFAAMLKDFQSAGKDLRDFIRAVLDNFGIGVKPYVMRFAQDLREGKLDDSSIGTIENQSELEGSGGVQVDVEDDVRQGDEGFSGDGDGRAEGISEVGGTDAGSRERGNQDNIEEPGFNLDSIPPIENLSIGKRIDSNVEAIKAMKTIVAENRKATNAEKRILAMFTGWGGLGAVFDNKTKSAKAKSAGNELKSILTDSEYREAGYSIRNAFYTSKEVVKAMWKGVESFGVIDSTSNILEPSSGTGNFIGWQPDNLKELSKWSGAELDPITGNIARLIYDDANIQVKGFQDAPFKQGVFSLAIGNPPFGDQQINDKAIPDISGLSIHNYMIAKSAKLLHEDGLMMMVVTRRFLDTLNKNHKTLSKIVDFVGAIRLPNTAFKDNAGTEVTTDIVVFRKLKEGEKAKNTVWTDVNGDIDGIKINKYFESNPQNILGRLADDGTMYGGRGDTDKKELTVHPSKEHENLGESIASALSDMAKGVDLDITPSIKEDIAGEVLLSESELPIGGMMLDGNGDILMREDDDQNGAVTRKVTADTPWSDTADILAKLKAHLNNRNDLKEFVSSELTTDKGTIAKQYSSKPFKVLKAYLAGTASLQELKVAVDEGINRGKLKDKYEILKSILGIRNSTLELIRAEKLDSNDIESLRRKLNKEYDSFTSKFGTKKKPISISENINLLRGDIGIESGLDSVDAKGVVSKHAIFDQRVIQRYVEPTSADNVDDAVSFSMQEHGVVDIGYIAKLMDIKYGQAKKLLTDRETPYLLENPETGKLDFVDDYLSGNVKQKLEEAKRAGLDKNVKLLEKVLPKDKPVDKVVPSIRATWIDPSVFESFLGSLGYTAKVSVSRNTGKISVIHADKGKKTELGVQFRHADKNIISIFEAAAAGKSIAIYRKVGENQVKDDDATKKVNLLINKIADLFKNYVKTNPELANQVAKNFNERVNTHAERQYNGRLYLKTVGQNPTLPLRKTQMDGAVRMIQSKNVLLDHTVGAGKTFTAIAGIMERRRLGLSKKPLVVVPNHIIGSFTSDFYELYPSAKILAVSEKQISAKNRKRFFSRIATGDYDAIIIGHSHLKALPSDYKDFEVVIKEKLDELKAALDEAKEEAKASGRRGSSVSQIQNSIAKMEEKLKAKKAELEETSDDIGFSFSDLGIDYLVIDEAHEFKNLTYSTKSDRVVGMNDPTGSDKAFDLLIKTRAVQNKQGGGITFMTGTPISNSLVEIYTMMYYLGHEDLKGNEISHFDSFAGSFLSTETALEYTPTGTVKERRVLKGVIGAAELATKYRQFADVVSRDDMVRIYAEDVAASNEKKGENVSTVFPIPKIKGGKRQLDSAPASTTQKEYNDYLIARMEAIEAVTGRAERQEYAKIDNPLWILSDAKKLSLDVRLIDPTADREPTGKVSRAAENIFRIYKKWDKDKGAQLVFSDMGTPLKGALRNTKKDLAELARVVMSEAKAKSYVDQKLGFYETNSYSKTLADVIVKVEGALEAGKIDSDKYDKAVELIHSLNTSTLTADSGFSVYDDLKAALVERGIPENEVAFIHSYDTADKKKALFDMVNSGTIRVLIGSTAKMGSGTNVQERLVALHHMDAPWRPSDMEQREGRIIRQGNELYERDPDGFEIEIIAYTSQGSSDPVMWQILERKAAGIEQFRAGGLDEFIDDSGSDSDSYAEFKAASTGNPVYRDKLKADREYLEAETDYFSQISAVDSAKKLVETYDSTSSNLDNELKSVQKFDLIDFDQDVVIASIKKEEDRFRKQFDTFETRVSVYESLTPAEKKKAKKPVRPTANPIYTLNNEYSKAMRESLIDPGIEAISSNVKEWQGNLDLGDGNVIEMDISQSFMSKEDDPFFDIDVYYVRNGVSLYGRGFTRLKTLTGSSNLLRMFDPRNISNSMSTQASILRDDKEDLAENYKISKKLAKLDTKKLRQVYDESLAKRDWLDAEVQVADAVENVRRGSVPNKFIDAETKRNVKRSPFDPASIKPELVEFEGETYKTIGIDVDSQNFRIEKVRPAINVKTNEYVHIGTDKEGVPESINHKPEGAGKEDSYKKIVKLALDAESKTKSAPSEQPSMFSAKSVADRSLDSNETPVSKKEADEVIDRITESWADGRDNLELVESFSDLPEAIKRDAYRQGAKENEINGVFYKDKLYLVRENHFSAQEIEETVFHEGYGHYGLKKLFGEDVRKKMGELYLSIGGSKGFNRIANENNIDLTHYAKGLRDRPRETRNAILMEELVAHIAQSNKPTLANKAKEILGAIRNWLRKNGFMSLAKYNDTDLMHLLKKSREAVQTGKNGTKIFTGEPRADKVAESMFSMTDSEQTSAIEKLGLGATNAKTIADKVNELINKNWSEAWKGFKERSNEGFFEGLAGLKRAEDKIGITDFSKSGYVGARLATGVADTMHAVLHYGAPQWREGILQHKRGTRGLLEIFGDLGPDLTNWLAWMGGNRGAELMKQGRENNLTRDDIKELKAKGAGKEVLFEKVRKDYIRLNNAMLDMAEEAGLIKPGSRQKWESDYYVPFYRQSEADGNGDATLIGPSTSRGLSHQSSGIKALRGGETSTNNLLENILTNWIKLTDSSMKNSALLKMTNNLRNTDYLSDETLRYQKAVIPKREVVKRIKGDRNYLEAWAEALGMDSTANALELAHEINKLNNEGYEELWAVVAPTDPDIIRIQREGKSEYYRVNDPSLLRAVTHLGQIGSQDPITKTGRYFKRLLTIGVTLSPAFILRNFARDAVHAWAINPDGFKFGTDSLKGLNQALKEDADYRALMFSGASFQGGYVHGTDPEASAHIVKRALEKKGFSPSEVESYQNSLLNSSIKVRDAVGRGWEKYRNFGDKVENSNRLATFKAALAAGKPMAQAVFESKDLMDYSMRGNFQAMIWFTDMIPFLNARMIGLHKLVRAAQENPKRVLYETGFKIAAFSVALAMLNDDDERYQELPDWDKDANWHFFIGDDHFRIPKPFEIGIMFGTIPERLYHTMAGNQDNEKLLWSIKHNFFHTLNINPIPQFVLPITEVIANRSFFFDKPIEGMSDEGKLTEARYNERTSSVMKEMGAISKWVGLSPKQLQHLWNGYLGTMGTYALGVADIMANQLTDRSVRPESRLEDLPVFRAFYKGSGPARSTQYMTDVYDRLNEVDEIYRTIRSYREEGRTEAAKELKMSSLEKLRHRKVLGKTRKKLGDLNKRMTRISRSEIYTARLKRNKLDILTDQKNKLVKKIADMTEDAF